MDDLKIKLVGAKPVLWDPHPKGDGLRHPWRTYDVAYFPKTSESVSVCGHFTVAAYDTEGNLREFVDLPETVVQTLLEQVPLLEVPLDVIPPKTFNPDHCGLYIRPKGAT